MQKSEEMLMKKIALITDSATNLPEEFMKEDFVYVAPLKVNIDGVEYYDLKDITPKEVAEKIETCDIKTTLVSPGEALDFYRQAIKDGYDEILTVNMSSVLSGTFNSFRVAAEQVEEVKITNFDTRSAGIGCGLQVVRAIELLKEGKTVEEIIADLTSRVEKSDVSLVPGTLKFLVKGGRVSKLRGAVGGILNIIPILEIVEDGTIKDVGKGRGFRSTIMTNVQRYIDKYRGKGKIDIGFSTSFDEAEVDLAEKTVREALADQVRNVYRTHLTSVLCTHSGPKNFVISMYIVE